ncbi:nuclear transport factor 2 family protein, partial [Klebsiella pneumoniae]|nr:nuclear transport factor 2 family protein [Klebsiella pneumoniae]
MRQTVLAVPTNADLRAFDAIAPLFADRVMVDYTSLWGG